MSEDRALYEIGDDELIQCPVKECGMISRAGEWKKVKGVIGHCPNCRSVKDPLRQFKVVGIDMKK